MKLESQQQLQRTIVARKYPGRLGQKHLTEFGIRGVKGLPYSDVALQVKAPSANSREVAEALRSKDAFKYFLERAGWFAASDTSPQKPEAIEHAENQVLSNELLLWLAAR